MIASISFGVRVRYLPPSWIAQTQSRVARSRAAKYFGGRFYRHNRRRPGPTIAKGKLVRDRGAAQIQRSAEDGPRGPDLN